MTGSGTALDPYIIWDVNDLQAMGNGAPFAPNAFYELGTDVDALATLAWNWNAGRGVFEGFVPITAFTGLFNGRYHIISHLYMDRYNGAGGMAAGLWGDANGATIQNLYITDATIISYSQWGLAHPANNTGVLIGNCGTCTVRRVIVRGSVTATNNDTVWFGPHGNCNAGGMVGLIWGASTFDECASYANVQAIAMSWAVAYSGGFVANYQVAPGHNWNCYSRGNVAGGQSGGFFGVDPMGHAMDNCYSTGTAGVGGFGAIGGAAVTDSFWDLDTSGIGVSQGGVGRHTPQMKTEANYTVVGWDFVNIWRIDLTGYWNDGYPYFVWDVPPTIQVVSPNGGENWLVGSIHPILWVHTGDPGANVRIELLRGWIPQVIIASTPIGAPGNGNYNWTIDPTQAPGNDYRVRITSTTTPITDTSDNDFTISAPAPPPAAAQVVTLPATEVR